MTLGIEYLGLFFIGVFYWPLLTIRILGIFRSFEFTAKKFLAAALFSAVSALLLFSIITEAYIGTYLPIAFMAAAVPIILLFLMPSESKIRTKAKIIILAAYFHIVWQMFPSINLVIIIVEIAATLVLAFASSYKRKNKVLLYRTSETSIGDMWK